MAFCRVTATPSFNHNGSGKCARQLYNNLQESQATKVTCAFAGTHLGTLSPVIVAFHGLWG